MWRVRSLCAWVSPRRTCLWVAFLEPQVILPQGHLVGLKEAPSACSRRTRVKDVLDTATSDDVGVFDRRSFLPPRDFQSKINHV